MTSSVKGRLRRSAINARGLRAIGRLGAEKVLWRVADGAPGLHSHCVITPQACRSGTHPTPAQQCWLSKHELVATWQTPALQMAREQVVVPPPLIACGVGPPPVVAVTQSLSWQH
jgi:hypothetical protein